MNLFKELVESAPVGNRLEFGYVENVRVMKVDVSVRKYKGLPIKQHIFVTLSEVNPETNVIISQSEAAYWNLDPTKDFVVSNVIDQFTSMGSIVTALGQDVIQFDEDVFSVVPEDTSIDDYIKTKEGAQAVQDSFILNAAKYIKPFIGPDSPLMKVKVTTNKKGFFELGKEENWIIPVDSEENLPSITAAERRAWRESLKADSKKQTKPDSIGGEKKVGAASTFAGL